MATELKELDLEATEFVANGVTYYIKPKPSFERFKWMEKYAINVGFGRDWQTVHKTIEKIVEFFNKGKSVEAFSLLNALKDSELKDLDKRIHPSFLMCALFMVTKDEDITTWDETLAKEKIDNWNKEGYDPISFFRIATNMVAGLVDYFTETFHNTSEAEEALKNLGELRNNG